jgi:hypothetical protein
MTNYPLYRIQTQGEEARLENSLSSGMQVRAGPARSRGDNVCGAGRTVRVFMNKLGGRNVLVGLVVFMFLGAAPVMACMCAHARGPVADQVKWAQEGSSAVFTGKVIGFEYRKGNLYKWPGVAPTAADGEPERETKLIRFQVDRWWKMAQPTEILIITDEWRPAKRLDEVVPSGNVFLLPQGNFIGGCSTAFMKDQSYLVYATGSSDRLQYRICSRTALLTRAEDDLKVLGKGRKPVKSEKE